ncbi:unnamed protein product [Allacma fusca]|uniref:Uncharacterized protein n=1 Tax=Allacma fusca TaxID=39272 RepID=A0A8J2JL75_9HEXA|nr:unnamed protein product [Allacma fusca]
MKINYIDFESVYPLSPSINHGNRSEGSPKRKVNFSRLKKFSNLPGILHNLCGIKWSCLGLTVVRQGKRELIRLHLLIKVGPRNINLETTLNGLQNII